MISIRNLGISFANGDEWETFCMSCLKIKYQNNCFTPVPANDGGDSGLDGFNNTGDAFQCYCPEKEYSDNELYEHLRDKITKDIKKLFTYRNDIASILNGKKIKVWHFVTPYVNSKKLIAHINTKTKEVIRWNLDFIEADFSIALKDFDYFLPEVPVVYNHKQLIKDSSAGIDFRAEEPTSDYIEKYKADSNNSEFVSNAIRKNMKLIPKESNHDFEKRVIDLTDRQVSDHFVGENIQKIWSEKFDQEYEKFLRIISVLEKTVMRQSILPTANNLEKLKEIENKVKQTLDREFPTFLSEANREELASSVVASWILNCSLDFN